MILVSIDLSQGVVPYLFFDRNENQPMKDRSTVNSIDPIV